MGPGRQELKIHPARQGMGLVRRGLKIYPARQGMGPVRRGLKIYPARQGMGPVRRGLKIHPARQGMGLVRQGQCGNPIRAWLSCLGFTVARERGCREGVVAGPCAVFLRVSVVFVCERAIAHLNVDVEDAGDELELHQDAVHSAMVREREGGRGRGCCENRGVHVQLIPKPRAGGRGRRGGSQRDVGRAGRTGGGRA
eukprot:scaffold2630_cov118-Isochrysis_galbana.AAC.7